MSVPPMLRRAATITAAAACVLGLAAAPAAVASGQNDTTVAGAAAEPTLQISSRTAAQDDRDRLGLALAPGTDLQPTRHYLPPDTELTVTVSGVSADDPNGVPSVAIGAPDTQLDPDAPEDTPWYEIGLKPRVTELQPGENTVSDKVGGVIYLQYPAQVDASSTAEITLGEQAEPMATFTLGETTERDFQKQLDEHDAPFVEFYSKRAMMTFQRGQALLYRDQKHAALLRTLDRIIRVEDKLAGYTNRAGAENEVPAGPHHLTGFPGGIDGVGAYATQQFTAYPQPIQDRLLTVEGLRTRGWGPYHELGHQHQMSAVNPGDLVEVSVNIYSLAVQRDLAAYGGCPRMRAIDDEGISQWDTAMADLEQGVADYADLGPFSKLAPFEQLRLGFGEDMLTDWHAVVRQQDLPDGEDADAEQRWQNVVYSTSVAAGADLSGFWDTWGVEVTEETQDQIKGLGLREPVVDPSTLRETNAECTYTESI